MTQVPPPTPQPVVPVCYRHPRREAHVRCTRCNRPICPDCMTEASVGHQCPECVSEGRRTSRSVRTIFGGTADSVALWFKSLGHETWFYYYLTAVIATSLVVYATMRDTKQYSAMGQHE